MPLRDGVTEDRADVKLVYVHKQSLLDIFAGRLRCELPEGCELLGVSYNIERDAFIMQVRHETFNEQRAITGQLPVHQCTMLGVEPSVVVHTRSARKTPTRYT